MAYFNGFVGGAFWFICVVASFLFVCYRFGFDCFEFDLSGFIVGGLLFGVLC